MPDNHFLESLSELPLEQKFLISEMCQKQPKLFAYLEKLFYQKLEAVKSLNRDEIENIYRQEKEEISRILSEIIKEQ